MPKRNREKLMEKSMYDFLCSMNANLRDNLRCTNVSTCIMYAIHTDYSEYDRIMRCNKHESDCGKCLQSWLNEYPF